MNQTKFAVHWNATLQEILFRSIGPPRPDVIVGRLGSGLHKMKSWGLTSAVWALLFRLHFYNGVRQYLPKLAVGPAAGPTFVKSFLTDGYCLRLGLIPPIVLFRSL